MKIWVKIKRLCAYKLGTSGTTTPSPLGKKLEVTVYSTLVRNTVVRATFKVSGKPPI